MSRNESSNHLTVSLAAIAAITISSLYSLADKYGLDKDEVISLFAEGLRKQASDGEGVVEGE